MINRGGHKIKKAKGKLPNEETQPIIRINGNTAKKSNSFSVRLPAHIHEFLREISLERHISASEVLRIVLSNRMDAYIGNVRFVDSEQGQKLIDLLTEWSDQIYKIRIELNRIGVNYHRHLER